MSVDQVIADKIGQNTLLPSLQLGTEPPRQGGSGEALPVSWANTVSFLSQRLTPEINPRVAFDRMFRFMSNPAEAKKQGQVRKSVLDLARGDLKELQRKASKVDKDKLDQYYSSIRAVEQSIEKTLNPGPKEWVSPMKPTYLRPPAGIPHRRDEHLKLMMDLMVLAFWTDTTRVGTLMSANGFTAQNLTFIDGVNMNHHTMSHHKNRKSRVEQYTKVSEWSVKQYAYLIDRMKNIDDGNGGSMLDNSLVLYGSGMKDGNVHMMKDLPLVIAGSAGGKLKPGSHIRAPESTILADLHTSLQQLYGVESKKINGRRCKTINIG